MLSGWYLASLGGEYIGSWRQSPMYGISFVIKETGEESKIEVE